MIEYSYCTLNGTMVSKSVTTDEAHQILDSLDEIERETRKYAPTDSGLTRMNNIRHANALRKVLFNG